MRACACAKSPHSSSIPPPYLPHTSPIPPPYPPHTSPTPPPYRPTPPRWCGRRQRGLRVAAEGPREGGEEGEEGGEGGEEGGEEGREGAAGGAAEGGGEGGGAGRKTPPPPETEEERRARLQEADPTTLAVGTDAWLAARKRKWRSIRAARNQRRKGEGVGPTSLGGRAVASASAVHLPQRPLARGGASSGMGAAYHATHGPAPPPPLGSRPLGAWE